MQFLQRHVTRLRTPALKSEVITFKIGRFSNSPKMESLKRSSPCFFPRFSVQE